MNSILAKASRAIAKSVFRNPMPLSERWGRAGFLHICFSSIGCRYNRHGFCSMCFYGHGATLNAEQARNELHNAMSRSSVSVSEVLLGTCGSILDEEEMPVEVFDTILEEVAGIDAETIIFETHFGTVTEKALQHIVDRIGGKKRIILELGYESADPFVLENCINKYMDLDIMHGETIPRIKKYGMGITLNVLLGTPFLSVVEQVEDAHRTLKTALIHGADTVVLFPLNIKVGTVVEYLYRKGRYARPSHWMTIELLSRLSLHELGRVVLSWFGDRQEAGIANEALPPSACSQCHDDLFFFFSAFMQDMDAERRLRLLSEISEKGKDCGCRMTFLDSLALSPKERREDRVWRELQILSDEYVE